MDGTALFHVKLMFRARDIKILLFFTVNVVSRTRDTPVPCTGQRLRRLDYIEIDRNEPKNDKKNMKKLQKRENPGIVPTHLITHPTHPHTSMLMTAHHL